MGPVALDLAHGLFYKALLHLPDIAPPLLVHYETKSLRGDIPDAPHVLGVELLDEMFRKMPYVLAALPERRQSKREYVEPVVEVLPEAAPFHLFFHVPVGRCQK